MGFNQITRGDLVLIEDHQDGGFYWDRRRAGEWAVSQTFALKSDAVRAWEQNTLEWEDR